MVNTQNLVRSTRKKNAFQILGMNSLSMTNMETASAVLGGVDHTALSTEVKLWYMVESLEVLTKLLSVHVSTLRLRIQRNPQPR